MAEVEAKQTCYKIYLLFSGKLQPNKDYYVVLSTLYQRQIFDMVQVALKKRSASNTTPKDLMVELIPTMLKLIYDMVSVLSKYIQQTFYLESHGETVDLLMIKSKFTKMRRKQMTHKAEIRSIINFSRYR